MKRKGRPCTQGCNNTTQKATKPNTNAQTFWFNITKQKPDKKWNVYTKYENDINHFIAVWHTSQCADIGASQPHHKKLFHYASSPKQNLTHNIP